LTLGDFIYELGSLKRTPRSGWVTIGIDAPESIAEHAWRTAAIGMLLARLEKCREERVIALCILPDLHETRIGDLNVLNRKYVAKDAMRAVADTVRGLFCELEIAALMREYWAGKTREALVASDADKLEMLATAREYIDAGNRHAKAWIVTARRGLRTRSAKRLAAELVRRDSTAWLFEAVR